MPADLIISFLALFFGLSGIVLSVSGMLNSYQIKKLEYIAYRNQGKAKTLLDGQEFSAEVASEAQYYRSHNLGGETIIDIDFITHGLKKDFLKLETYISFLKTNSSKVIEFFVKLDFDLISKQCRVWMSKSWKYTKVKYSESVDFLLKITQPIDSNDMVPDHSSARSALATSSRIKNLNQTFQNLTDRGQKFIKTRFSKTKIDVWPNHNSDINFDHDFRSKSSLQSSAIKSSTLILPKDDDEVEKLNTALKTNSDAQVYQQLEENILDKLHENLTDFRLWESLGDFYNQHKEHDKADEVFNYINKHSRDENQLNRLKTKI